jgi:hypothetical protein
MKFSAGERVEHLTMGEGTVQRCEKGEVHVIFDRLRKNGENQRGTYDENWFKIYPGWFKKLPRKFKSGPH